MVVSADAEVPANFWQPWIDEVRALMALRVDVARAPEEEPCAGVVGRLELLAAWKRLSPAGRRELILAARRILEEE